MSLLFVSLGMWLCTLIAFSGAMRGHGRSPALRWLVASVLLALSLISAAYWLFKPPGPQVLSSDESTWLNATPYRELLLFVLMLIGMTARFVTAAIEERRAQIAALRASGKTDRRSLSIPIRFDRWELVYPMMVSVITFGALLHQLESTEVTLANAIISFQTGFFWQTILVRAEPRQQA